ncbi:hypothetical protein HYH02_011965 [Chlamydomonas schloesseri]|uniref:Uncharacterized protein n=1 Tax=Chlamydomonas schloesseri TaxID=2026947 RepID=A0A835TAS1_9CHLO|nr:hypothetical protein HYH02_011965 [Chlamydomonas schloesseri]|eukprot:KAG2435465.1 hypothetical protein HYH02_011965 [Chlamydomonas schloesseri]
MAHWGRPEPWRALSLQQRRRLLCLAANSGCADSLEAALAHCGCSLTTEVAVAAVLGGSVAAVETLLIREGCDCSRKALEEVAAEAGQLEVLQWLRQARQEQLVQAGVDRLRPAHEQPPAAIAVAVAACRGGHAHVLAWLGAAEKQQQQPQLPQPGALAGEPLTIAHPKAVPFLAGAAAEGGHVEVLDQLLPRLEPIPSGAACSMLCKMAQGCPREVLQRAYLHLFRGSGVELGTSLKHSLAVAAAVSSTTDWEAKLDWALLQEANDRLPVRPDPTNSFLKGDVDWLIDPPACALPDWLQRLQALHARRVPLPLPRLRARAAMVGNVAALRWLLEAQQGGYEGDAAGVSEDLLSLAAEIGHVPVLAELSERGGVFGGPHVVQAAEQGKADAVRWLLAQPLQPPVTNWPPVSANLAQQSGADLALLRQLHEQHGVVIEVDAMAHGCSVEVLDWAVALLREESAARRGGQEPAHFMRGLLQDLQCRIAWKHGALGGNLAAADWATQLLMDHGYAPPLVPTAADRPYRHASFWENTFAALRWWLRQRQEGRGVTRVVNQEGEDGGARFECVGALTDTEWRTVLDDVASSVFPPPIHPGEWKFSRAQWNWLVGKRLDAAAADAMAKGAGPEQVQAAVAVARTEVEELASTATRRNPFQFQAHVVHVAQQNPQELLELVPAEFAGALGNFLGVIAHAAVPAQAGAVVPQQPEQHQEQHPGQ